MSSRRCLLVVGAPALPLQIAVGPEFANRCIAPATVGTATPGRNGKLIELTSDQWQFLRGIYAMNLEAPPGLPYGDKAVFTPGGGDFNGLLFFVDGDKACTPMNAPPALLSLVDRVAAGEPIIKELPPGKSRSVDQRMKADRGISSPAADTSSYRL